MNNINKKNNKIQNDKTDLSPYQTQGINLDVNYPYETELSSASCRQKTNVPSNPQKIRAFTPKQRARSNFDISR